MPYDVVQVQHHQNRENDTGQRKADEDNIRLVANDKTTIFDTVHLTMILAECTYEHFGQITLPLHHSRKPVLSILPLHVLVEIILIGKRFLLPRVRRAGEVFQNPIIPVVVCRLEFIPNPLR